MFVTLTHNNLILSKNSPRRLFDTALYGKSVNGLLEREERQNFRARVENDFADNFFLNEELNEILSLDSDNRAIRLREASAEVDKCVNPEVEKQGDLFSSIEHNINITLPLPYRRCRIYYHNESLIGCKFLALGRLPKYRGVDKAKFYSRVHSWIDLLSNSLLYSKKTGKPYLQRKKPNIKFFTLTFPLGTSDEIAVKLWNNFVTRFRKVNGSFSFVRVCERQANGTIHFHFLSDSFIDCKQWSQYIGKSLDKYLPSDIDWKNRGDVESYSFLDISQIRDEKGKLVVNPYRIDKKGNCRASYYMMKYLTKADSTFFQPIAYSRGFSKLSSRFNFSSTDFEEFAKFSDFLYDEQSQYIVKTVSADKSKLLYQKVGFASVDNSVELVKEVCSNQFSEVSKIFRKALTVYNIAIYSIIKSKTYELYDDVIELVSSFIGVDLTDIYNRFETTRVKFLQYRSQKYKGPYISCLT